VDNIEFSDYPLYAFQKGNYTHMPLIIGTVTDEVLPFIYKASHNPVSELEAIAAIEYIFGLVDGTEILFRYPPQPNDGIMISEKIHIYFLGDDYRNWMGFVGTLYIFTCSTRNVVSNIATNPPLEPVYLYHVRSFCDMKFIT
jgi:hypothetical protein